MTKADALEMLSSFLADLVLAGVVIDKETGDGVVVLRLHDVAEAQDDEGVYFVPYAPVVDVPDVQPAEVTQ